MIKKFLSTGFSLLFAFALLLPVSHSLVQSEHSILKPVNVTGTCIQIKTEGGKVKVCEGGLQQLDVSWNSGGG